MVDWTQSREDKVGKTRAGKERADGKRDPAF